MQLDDLYRRVIMDHYQKPRNRGSIENGTLSVEMNNPTCGDRIVLQMKVEDGTIKEARFDGEGCSISIASASMMTQAIKGKNVKTALELADRFSHLMQGKDVEFEELEDIEALQGVSKFPARIKCATLSWKAMERGIHQNSKGN
jgi:nitrogen fixation NifU-like protein